jgi:hypothetical protein
VVGSYHTELAAYAGLRTGQAQVEALAASRWAASTAPVTWSSRPAPRATSVSVSLASTSS